MHEPLWIQENVVLAIHRRQIAEHGGADGVRDHGLLASALNKPRNLYDYETPKPDLAALAASYAYGIIRNHPFTDGNKRTALVICILFLTLNDVQLSASGEEKYRTVMQLADGLSQDEFAAWLRDYR